jgi:tetratricopeptide (TPR) repeat protein
VQSVPSTDRYTRSLAALWNNRGVVLRDSARLDEASEAFAKSVQLEEVRMAKAATAGPTLLAMQYANQVQVLGRLGRVEEAARIETKRQALVKKMSSPPAGEAGKEKSL